MLWFVKVHAMIKQELECLKMKQKELVDELNTYKDQVRTLVCHGIPNPVYLHICMALMFHFTRVLPMCIPNDAVRFVKVHAMIKQELECLKMKQKELVDELNTYKDQVRKFFFFPFIKSIIIVLFTYSLSCHDGAEVSTSGLKILTGVPPDTFKSHPRLQLFNHDQVTS